MITLSVGALDIHWFAGASLLPSKGCVENATKEYMYRILENQLFKKFQRSRNIDYDVLRRLMSLLMFL